MEVVGLYVFLAGVYLFGVGVGVLISKMFR